MQAVTRSKIGSIVPATRRIAGKIWSAARRAWLAGGRAWLAGGRSRYRPWLGWPLLGLLLLIPGLALPWLAIPLRPGRTAWTLPVVVAGIPAISRVSYGAVLAACLAAGLLAAARSRGRASAETAAVGATVLIISLGFLVASGTADWALLQLLEDQTSEQATIFSQFGYATPN